MLSLFVDNLGYRFMEWLVSYRNSLGEQFCDEVGYLAIPDETKCSHGLLMRP